MKPAAILLTTYHQHEHLVDACIQSLQHTWPEHPPVIVLSDRGRFEHPHKILINRPSWSEMLNEGLSSAIAQELVSPDDYILLLLEDHVPLSPLPLERLENALATAAEHALPHLALFGHGKAAIFQQEPETIYTRAVDYPFYSELHPALWKVAYLKQMAQSAVNEGKNSAWEFEKQQSQATHYTTGALWTSELGGFLAEGRVDWSMLKKMQAVEFTSLRRKLKIKAIRALPYRICRRIFKRP